MSRCPRAEISFSISGTFRRDRLRAVRERTFHLTWIGEGAAPVSFLRRPRFSRVPCIPSGSGPVAFRSARFAKFPESPPCEDVDLTLHGLPVRLGTTTQDGAQPAVCLRRRHFVMGSFVPGMSEVIIPRLYRFRKLLFERTSISLCRACWKATENTGQTSLPSDLHS